MSKLSAKLRWTVLGVMFSLSLAALGLVADERESPPQPLRSEGAEAATAPEPAISRESDEALPKLSLERLDRTAMAEPAADLFSAKSWYVPPTPHKFTEPPAPTAPSLPFTYLGKMEEEPGKWVVYLAEGEAVHPVRPGDVIEGAYRVEGIAGGQITLLYLPLSIRQTLATGGGAQ